MLATIRLPKSKLRYHFVLGEASHTAHPQCSFIKKGASKAHRREVDISGECFLSTFTKARLHAGSQNLPSICCKDRDDRCCRNPLEPAYRAIVSARAAVSE